MRDEKNMWWPNDVSPKAGVVEGTNKHMDHAGRRRDTHLFTLKQTPTHLIWACACGETYSREKI